MATFAGTTQKCNSCEKTVYFVELITDNKVYHKACFRCHHCKGTLKLSNYSSYEGVLYCKPHFDQLLKMTGSLDKSFKGTSKTVRVDRSADQVRINSKVSSMFAGTQEKCVACIKTVYPLERMRLLLESNGIIGFVDGTHLCPSSITVDECGTHNSPSSSSSVDNDDVLVWKLHDRALMQLITATLSPIAMSCAIGSISSRDLWNRLIEQFSIVSQTSIFQMKSNLQNIRKGGDTISQYFLKIKEARDYLTAAGVHFPDEDIVILALNGLPSEYNTFRCVIRGRESVISLKEFRTQLLAEEKIVDTINPAIPSYFTAMHTKSAMSSPTFGQSHNGSTGYNSYSNGGYKQFNRGRGKGRFNQGFRGMNDRPQYPVKSSIQSPFQQQVTPRMLGSSSPYTSVSSMQVCQLCNREGHLAPVCNFRRDERHSCNICGRTNHTTWFCFYNDRGPNFSGSTTPPAIPTQSSGGSSHDMQAMHTVAQSTPSSSQVWLADTGATNHMTSALQNLTLASHFPVNDSVQTANGEGQGHREDNLQRLQQ